MLYHCHLCSVRNVNWIKCNWIQPSLSTDLVLCPTPLTHCHRKGLLRSCNHKSHCEAASSLLACTCRGNVPRGRIRHALRTVGNTATPEAAWDELPSFNATSSFFDLQSSRESRGSEGGTSFLEADPGDLCTGSCWRPQQCAASASRSLTRAGLGLRYRCWGMSQDRLSCTCKRWVSHGELSHLP